VAEVDGERVRCDPESWHRDDTSFEIEVSTLLGERASATRCGAGHPVRVLSVRTVVVSGAPGTGKSTLASALAGRLQLPLLSLDCIKEALADVLGLGDELWSDRVGDAAAEVVFRLARSFPGAVAEGWWRRDRRARAHEEFQGCTEVFCRCDPAVAQQRATARLRQERHPIHRDVINPTIVEGLAAAVGDVEPLRLGGELIEVDTTNTYDLDELVARVRVAAGTNT
jgi:predicted kinase